jgi:glutaryl-CoA dehydrogenase
MIWAKLNGEIRGFLVERSTAGPGLSTPPIKNKNGLRASITGMVLLDDVEVSAENVLPNIDRRMYGCSIRSVGSIAGGKTDG